MKHYRDYAFYRTVLSCWVVVYVLLMYSCSSKKVIPMQEDQMSYQAFRNQQHSFQSADGTIKYIDQGVGDVIVLLHGVPTSGWLYRNMIDELAKEYRVIVPDMLGFGSSDSPKGYDIYSESNHAKRLLALMDALEIETWNHVMHDAGGLWTFELLKQDSRRIKKLVMLNSIVFEEGFKPPMRMEPGFMAKAAMWGYRNGITTNLMLKGLFKTGLQVNNLTKQDVEGYKQPLLEGKTRAMYYFFTQTCAALPDYTSLTQEISISTRVIWGSHDEFLLWNPQKSEVMTNLSIPQADVSLIDAKHFIQEEKPEEIVLLIQSFLDKE